MKDYADMPPHEFSSTTRSILNTSYKVCSYLITYTFILYTDRLFYCSDLLLLPFHCWGHNTYRCSATKTNIRQDCQVRKVWQLFRHVSLRTWIQCLILITCSLSLSMASLSMGSSASLWQDTALAASTQSCQGRTRSLWLMRLPEWRIVPVSCLMHQ